MYDSRGPYHLLLTATRLVLGPQSRPGFQTPRTPFWASAAAWRRTARSGRPSLPARLMQSALLRLRPRRRSVDVRARGRLRPGLHKAAARRGLHAASPKFRRPLGRGATVTAVAIVRERVGLLLHAAPEIDRKLREVSGSAGDTRLVVDRGVVARRPARWWAMRTWSAVDGRPTSKHASRRRTMAKLPAPARAIETREMESKLDASAPGMYAYAYPTKSHPVDTHISEAETARQGAARDPSAVFSPQECRSR